MVGAGLLGGEDRAPHHHDVVDARGHKGGGEAGGHLRRDAGPWGELIARQAQADDPVGADHDMLGKGLRKALYNYMLGHGLDADVRVWFDTPRRARTRRARRRAAAVPKTTVPRDLIARSLSE